MLVLAACLILSAGTAFAAPVNDLGRGQTALGFGSDAFYLEHKLTDTFTLGFQDADWVSADDIYGQFDLSGNLRGIVGSRSFPGESKVYIGAAVHGPMGPEWDGYASLIGGGSFSELQVGANFRLSHNLDLNLDYHSYMPDLGRNKSGVGVGLTLKF